ncbi:MAG: response regulator [Nitrospinota bacterium]
MKILIVDDNQSNRELIVNIIKILQFDFIEALNGEEAVDIAKRERPDLILMDIAMPGMDGFEATRQIKAGPATSDIPIIALTAKAMRGDQERILEAGCDDYIAKPIETLNVMERIKSILGQCGDKEAGK